MKLIALLMTIFSHSVFALDQNPKSDDFYFGAEHVEKCTSLISILDNSDNKHFDFSRCVADMSKVRIAKLPKLYNKIAIDCHYAGEKSGKDKTIATSKCLEEWDGVLLPEESETTCRSLSASECRNLYANSLRKFPIEPDKILMEKLKNAVSVGNLDLARNLINTIQRKKEMPVVCESSNPGLEVSDTRLQKLNGDINKALEVNKSVLGK